MTRTPPEPWSAARRALNEGRNAMAKKHTPGPWLDGNLNWLHDPHRLLTRTEDALLMGYAPELLRALRQLHDATVMGNVLTRHVTNAKAAIDKVESSR